MCSRVNKIGQMYGFSKIAQLYRVNKIAQMYGTTSVIFGKKARNDIIAGVVTLNKATSVTLGPKVILILEKDLKAFISYNRAEMYALKTNWVFQESLRMVSQLLKMLSS